MKDAAAWRSVSALAPIANPTNCAWGQKAFQAYLGNICRGEEYDATCILLTRNESLYDNILIDQGTLDEFLEKQLKPDALKNAAKKAGQKITMNMRKGFDHSYYFVAAFIASHIEFHSTYLHV